MPRLIVLLRQAPPQKWGDTWARQQGWRSAPTPSRRHPWRRVAPPVPRCPSPKSPIALRVLDTRSSNELV